jgi:hypothetical protein
MIITRGSLKKFLLFLLAYVLFHGDKHDIRKALESFYHFRRVRKIAKSDC